MNGRPRSSVRKGARKDTITPVSEEKTEPEPTVSRISSNNTESTTEKSQYFPKENLVTIQDFEPEREEEQTEDKTKTKQTKKQKRSKRKQKKNKQKNQNKMKIIHVD